MIIITYRGSTKEKLKECEVLEEKLQSNISLKIIEFNNYFHEFCRKMIEISGKMDELDKTNSKDKELHDNWKKIDQNFSELNNIRDNIEDFDQKIIEEKTLLLKDLLKKCDILEKILKIELFNNYFYEFCGKMIEINKKMDELNKVNSKNKVNPKFKELDCNLNEIDRNFSELNNIKDNIEDFDQKIIEEKTLLLKDLLKKCEVLESGLQSI